MATLRDLRRRINSVKSTQKITKAMELVAAAKMRRAHTAMEASRPYAEAIREVLTRLAQGKMETTHPFLVQREVKSRLLLLVTADRGLAGGLNANAIRTANRFIQGGPPTRLVTIGRKGRDFFRRFDLQLVADSSMLPDRPHLDEIRPPVTVAMDEYLDGNVDEVWLVYTRYVNPVSQLPVTVRLIPPDIPAVARPETERPQVQSLYEFEPGPEAVLGALLPRYVEAQVYRAVLENQASFYAAQMTAMRSASDNAGDLIQDLTLVANKLRQAQITKELMEIVGGAEALAQARGR